MIFPPDGHGPYRLLRALGGAPVARFQQSLAEPEAAQRARLKTILDGAKSSAFARAFHIRGTEGLAEFRDTLPIVDHATHRPWLDRVEAGEHNVLRGERVLQLVQTSGTTGAPKRLPVTGTWARSVADAQRLWVLGLLRDDEGLAGGSALSIVSPAVAGHTSGGLPVGSNTGRMFLAQPFWVRWRAPVPYEAYGIADVSLRQYTILRHALATDVRSWTAANPSTILLYTRRLHEWWEELRRDLADGTLNRTGSRGLARRTLGDTPAWPWNLRRLNCWTGGPARFFVDRLPAAMGRKIPVREVGVTASEGYFAVPVDDGDPVAWLGGHLLEFVDEGGVAHWAWEVQAGQVYRLVVTTEAGLYRYDLGDLVQITGFLGRVPRMVFLRRAGAELSAVGERVTEAQLQAALQESVPAASAIAATIAWAEVPSLTIAIGTTEELPLNISDTFDRALVALNLEYADRRATGRYHAPQILRIDPAAWERWKATRVAAGAPEAQVKDPVALDAAAFAELVSLGAP
ncbi:MAG: hypothetical protein EXR71_14220 [Myxococcales bacterium]|nr:hypothetical protein [Myxococcales bacterium]